MWLERAFADAFQEPCPHRRCRSRSCGLHQRDARFGQPVVRQEQDRVPAFQQDGQQDARAGDAEDVPDPVAHLQGRRDARSLEGEHGEPVPASEELQDLRLVGKTRAQDEGGRPAGAGGILSALSEPDEPEFELLPGDQHGLSEHLRQGQRPHRHASDDPRCLLFGRLLFDDERADHRDFRARPRRVQGRPGKRAASGLSLPHDGGKHGAPPRQSEHRILENAEGRLRPVRSDQAPAGSECLREEIRLQSAGRGAVQCGRPVPCHDDAAGAADGDGQLRQGLPARLREGIEEIRRHGLV